VFIQEEAQKSDEIPAMGALGGRIQPTEVWHVSPLRSRICNSSHHWFEGQAVGG